MMIEERAWYGDSPLQENDSFVDLKLIDTDNPLGPIRMVFNLEECLLKDNEARGKTSWFLVEFVSVRKPGASEKLLDWYDQTAHQEAMRQPGYDTYYRGATQQDGSCRSFCVWDDPESSMLASGHYAHKSAVGVVADMYSHYELKRMGVALTPKGFQYEEVARPSPSSSTT